MSHFFWKSSKALLVNASHMRAQSRPIRMQTNHVFDSSNDVIDLNPPAEDPSTAVPKSGHDVRQK